MEPVREIGENPIIRQEGWVVGRLRHRLCLFLGREVGGVS